MLSAEDNELLTRVGPATPMGELFRRFWLPALLPAELPAPDCAPVRLRLLGEDLVAFRDSTGQVGFLAALCAHRRAPLFFGRVEQAGLRCVYHGWKYDVAGNCVDMPNEPPTSNFKGKVHQPAYPAREYGGLIWIYMGPSDHGPELPQLEWALVPDSHRHLSKWIQDTNYAQGLEGEIDNSHTMFLHSRPNSFLRPTAGRGSLIPKTTDQAPTMMIKETDYGFMNGVRRTIDGSNDYYWRVTQWLLPDYSITAGGDPGGRKGGRCWIPIDDEHTWTFAYSYHPDRPLSADEHEYLESGAFFPPRLLPSTFRPQLNKDNDYGLDRERQRTESFTGIYGFNAQDRSVQEGMGAIVDRSKEHLGTSDLAVIAARRVLLRRALELQQGIEPYAASHGEIYRVRSLLTVAAEENFDRLLAAHKERMRIPSRRLGREPQPQLLPRRKA
jgi:phthalate 4,5-dioxygenase